MRKCIFFTTFLLFSLISFGQDVHVGDILCVKGYDTITVRPQYYTEGAIGVVFYVDETGQHGWVLHPEIQAQNILGRHDALRLQVFRHQPFDIHGAQLLLNPMRVLVE